jgi:hypothetical protein
MALETPDTLALGEVRPTPRDPQVLMKPERLAALQPSRLSLTRTFIRKAINERWEFKRLSFDIDERSVGTAHYRLNANGTLIDFPLTSFEYKGEGRTGRIIGRSWDMMGALIDGATSPEEADFTRKQLPKLYEGRATPNTLTWARANRSSRAFDHTVESLAAGRQPDIATLAEVCYLMRNTGIDGNGTFGTRSFKALDPSHPLRQTLAAQMTSAYMMRIYAVDLVNHLAKMRSKNAVELAPEIQRFLGIGNGSALGLIFFLQNHPKLIDRWLSAREHAIAAAKCLKLDRGSPLLAHLLGLLEKTITFRQEDRMVYEKFAPSNEIAAELGTARELLRVLYQTGQVEGAARTYPLAAIADVLEQKVHRETHETLLALYIELVPELADRLADDAFSVDEELCVQPEMSVAFLRTLLHDEYGWAFKMDLSTPESQRYIWYKSATAEEPRRGPREEVENAHQLGLDLPRYVQELDVALAQEPAEKSVAKFLLKHPRFRSVVARIQGLRGLQYHSPHMNIMAEDFVPIHIVRLLNVAIHGIDRPRDYLGRNLRGVLFLGAPTPADLIAGTSNDWFNPTEPK